MKYLIAILFTLNIAANCRCPKNLKPVCADGQTFGNACMARCEGNFKFAKGACSEVSKKLKKKEVKAKSCVCPMHWMPVCGVDGKTYGNSCSASCEGVSIKKQGSCESIKTH